MLSGPPPAGRLYIGTMELGASTRAAWPVRIVPLRRPPDDDLSATTTAEERLAMMWPLALDAWSTMERPVPDYPRHRAPVHLVPLRES